MPIFFIHDNEYNKIEKLTRNYNIYLKLHEDNVHSIAGVNYNKMLSIQILEVFLGGVVSADKENFSGPCLFGLKNYILGF